MITQQLHRLPVSLGAYRNLRKPQSLGSLVTRKSESASVAGNSFCNRKGKCGSPVLYQREILDRCCDEIVRQAIRSRFGRSLLLHVLTRSSVARKCAGFRRVNGKTNLGTAE